MYFPTKYLRPYHQNHPKPHFRDLSMQNLLQIALHKSHVNGATKVKLYSSIGIGKYLGVCQNFSARGRLGVHGPLM